MRYGVVVWCGYFSVYLAGCVMLLECIGMVSLLSLSSPLLFVLSRTTDSSPPPPPNTKSPAPAQLHYRDSVFSLTELSSQADLGWNLNVEDNVGVVVRNVVVTVLLVGLKGAAPWEVWSRHIVSSRHHSILSSSCDHWDTSCLAAWLPGVYFILMMPHCSHPLCLSAALLNCCSSNDHGNTQDGARLGQTDISHQATWNWKYEYFKIDILQIYSVNVRITRYQFATAPNRISNTRKFFVIWLI